ncbi:Tyrosine-protein phosphatase non-receptor type 9 [Geodia barretti]|nr:Tyrosine-protein phosphatase non-receptor type 9 [Geodia barretti]
MVWEQQVHVIVMTTKCVELGRHKCTQYWPEEGVVQYGNVTVTVSRLQQYEGYELRTMNISCTGVERNIKHFQFLAWPDYGVPTSGSTVLDLISVVREAAAHATTTTRSTKPSSSSGDHKIIVHCSAGVGRSGAFCVIHNCIDEFREKGTVNVQGAVRALRHQRAYAIQTDEQYEFCYRTILQFMKTHRN